MGIVTYKYLLSLIVGNLSQTSPQHIPEESKTAVNVQGLPLCQPIEATDNIPIEQTIKRRQQKISVQPLSSTGPSGVTSWILAY